jgi:hypothetical protein
MAGAAGAAAGRSSGGGGAVTVAAATGGATRVLSGGAGAGPVARPIRESLGEQVIPGPGGAGGTPDGARPGYTPSGERIGRNDPCWCGSGVKYKKCHGR